MDLPHVELTVHAKLEADYDKHRHLLPGREISRRASEDGRDVLITMAMPEAPSRAAVMSPWFTLTGDRIALGGIEYYDTDGKPID